MDKIVRHQFMCKALIDVLTQRVNEVDEVLLGLISVSKEALSKLTPKDLEVAVENSIAGWLTRAEDECVLPFDLMFDGEELNAALNPEGGDIESMEHTLVSKGIGIESFSSGSELLSILDLLNPRQTPEIYPTLFICTFSWRFNSPEVYKTESGMDIRLSRLTDLLKAGIS